MNGQRLMPLLSAVLLAALAFALVPCASAQDSQPSSIKLEDKSRGAETSLELPRSLFTDPQLATRTIKDAAEDMLKFRQEAQKALAEPGMDPKFWRDWTLSIAVTESLRNDRFISLLHTHYSYTGGAHGNVGFGVTNYDRQRARELTLADFFGPLSDGARVLRDIASFVQRKIAEKQGEFADKKWIAEGSSPKVEIYSSFTLAPSRKTGKIGGMTFHFAPYSVGPYAAGDFHITVPQDVFAKYLKKDMRGLFADQPLSGQKRL